MAKNWKVGEAVRAIMSGNKEDILDIGRRFPLFLNLASQTNEAGAKLLDCVPDYVTARKIEAVLKGDVTSDEGGEDTGDVGEEKTEKAKTKKTEKKDEYTGKSPKELYELCKSRGLKVEAKKPAEVYIKALKDDDAKKAKAEAAKKEDDDWEDEGAIKNETKKGKKEEKIDDDDWDI